MDSRTIPLIEAELKQSQVAGSGSDIKRADDGREEQRKKRQKRHEEKLPSLSTRKRNRGDTSPDDDSPLKRSRYVHNSATKQDSQGDVEDRRASQHTVH